MIFDRLIVDQW